MKLVVIAALALWAPRAAHAISACAGTSGFARGDHAILPPHPRLVFYDTSGRSDVTKVVAKVAGKTVKTKLTKLGAADAFRAVLVEIDSDATGELAIDVDGSSPAHFEIRKDAKTPDKVQATIERFHDQIPHTSVREVFDGVAIVLDADAIVAHVKIRRDAKADWRELDVPVTKDLLDDKKHPGRVLLGELGCVQNYSPALLAQGVDVEVTVTLTDGRVVPVQDLTHIAKKP